MTTDVRASYQTVKPSICYACDKTLYNYSMLICAECLDNECEKFISLVEDQPKNIKKRKNKT